MNRQHQVVLSLGSNQGNRLENIQTCISLIHKTVGTVIRVSKIYETPSWGFESDAFYNCALLLHTDLPAEKVLDKILEAEKQLGRIRNGQLGYQARIIDIDIVTFDQLIIETETLHIPHPQMQNRLFVLLPMKDLNYDWSHPKTKQTIEELVKETDDKSDCKIVESLEAPLENFNIKQFRHIAIEGNIGVGKTTLSTKISEDFNAKLVLERFSDNPFLPKFYKDQHRYAFPLEISFLADRHQQLSEDLSQLDLFKDFIVSDYHFFKSLVFAKVTLTDDEYLLYRNLFNIIYKEMPKPDLFVYLYQNTERLLQQIKLRGRSYEQEIPAEYLEKINQSYLNHIKTQTDLNVLIIDVSDMDFVEKQEDYLEILNAIQNKLIG